MFLPFILPNLMLRQTSPAVGLCAAIAQILRKLPTFFRQLRSAPVLGHSDVRTLIASHKLEILGRPELAAPEDGQCH